MTPFYIAGPTSAGKNSVAITLAQRCQGEIVNADAFQVYKGLDIITAKPSPKDLATVPHHLYSIVDSAELFNAARFAEVAQPCIEEILSRQKQPLVTGGTGLYLKSLTHGLSNLPAPSPELRAELDARSLDELVEQFKTLDPHGASQTNLANRRYVQRALEITLQTGTPMSVVKSDWKEKSGAPRDLQGVIITRPREELYARINLRVHEMFQRGAIDEVAQATTLSLTAEKAIGVPEIRALLAGRIDRESCIALIQKATRRFAKRQLTWFKKENAFQTICLSATDTPESTCDQINELFPSLLAKP
ncbi:MAG: tRNA (adenosine(37)-N6)-dimethylallyltransferase MiaA [Verrucomicrobiota bacterium]